MTKTRKKLHFYSSSLPLFILILSSCFHQYQSSTMSSTTKETFSFLTGTEQLSKRLFDAVINNNHVLVNLLLRAKADPNTRLKEQGSLVTSPLHYAVTKADQGQHPNEPTGVMKLLLEAKANPDFGRIYSGSRFTPAMNAASNGWPSKVQLLVRHKADINIVNKSTGSTAACYFELFRQQQQQQKK